MPAGLYLHIPWCKQACFYCDFHFRAALHDKDRILRAMAGELSFRSEELADSSVSTLYFGGGTPSLLSLKELETLLKQIDTHYKVSSEAEITLEANPDDLDAEYLSGLNSLGINRLSIGLQSFNDRILRWMNRRHTAREAIRSVERAARAGFKNINIDLMYAIPGLSVSEWEDTLEIALNLPVQHLSAYHLTIEEKTPFGVFLRRGELSPADEALSELHFLTLLSKTGEKGFEHYEISNFSLPEFQSRHNSAYWEQKPYLGIGPSAHSFNGRSRRWNVSQNQRYAECLEQGIPCYEEEILTLKDRYNEYLMTSLRTRKGADPDQIGDLFGESFAEEFRKGIEPYLQQGFAEWEGARLRITLRGILLSDRIISDLFMTE